MEHPADAIAENLRRNRGNSGLSLDGVAELTGINKSMRRQIEMGKSSPTIPTLGKIVLDYKSPFHRC